MHDRCRGWLQTITEGEESVIDLVDPDKHAIDLFSEPLKGIHWLSQFSAGPWKTQMHEYFGQIKERLTLMLSRVYDSCVERIEVYLAANEALKSNITALCRKIDRHSWESKLFYE